MDDAGMNMKKRNIYKNEIKGSQDCQAIYGIGIDISRK